MFGGGFSYFGVIIPGIIALFGIILIRKKNIMDVLQLTVYLLVLMILGSSLFGMFKTTFGADKISYRLIGTGGEYFASILYQLIGSFPSYLLLFILVTIFIFLFWIGI